MWLRFCQVCPCTCVPIITSSARDSVSPVRPVVPQEGQSRPNTIENLCFVQSQMSVRTKKKSKFPTTFFYPTHIQKECLPAIGQLSNLWELQAVKDLETPGRISDGPDLWKCQLFHLISPAPPASSDLTPPPSAATCLPGGSCLSDPIACPTADPSVLHRATMLPCHGLSFLLWG